MAKLQMASSQVNDLFTAAIAAAVAGDLAKVLRCFLAIETLINEVHSALLSTVCKRLAEKSFEVRFGEFFCNEIIPRIQKLSDSHTLINTIANASLYEAAAGINPDWIKFVISVRVANQCIDINWDRVVNAFK